MSQVTFNIADYRPISRGGAHDGDPAAKGRTGFVVFSSNSEPREYVDAPPAVVDIRSVRDAHRTSPRRGKILRFSNPASHRLYTMPAHDSAMSADDDPGPLVA